MSSMIRSFTTLLSLSILTILSVPVVSAQNIGVSGRAAYLINTDEVIELPDGNVLAYVRLHTVLIENDEANPQHLLSQDCSGVDLLTAAGDPLQIGGSCTGVDSDGHLLRISYLNTAQGGTWRYAGGTGKFAGVEGGGTSTVISVGHDGRVTLSYTGTMKLKAN